MKWPSLRRKSSSKETPTGDPIRDPVSGTVVEEKKPKIGFLGKLTRKSADYDTISTTSGSSINSFASEDIVDPRNRPSVQRLLNERLANMAAGLGSTHDIRDDHLIDDRMIKDGAGLTPIMEDGGYHDVVDDGILVDGPEAAHNNPCTLFAAFCTAKPCTN